MKKLFSMLIALAIVLSIIPLGSVTAFAALASVETVGVSGVGVPAVGAKPDYANAVSGNAPYTIEETAWIDLDGDRVLAENETFLGGHQYKIVFTLKAKVDYEFKKDGDATALTGTVNSEDAVVSAIDGKDASRYVSLSYTFPLLDPVRIDQVNLAGLARPSMGAFPDFDVAVNGAGYTVKAVRWYDADGDAYLSETTSFIGGRAYTVFIDVEAKQGYYFNTNEEGASIVGGILNGNSRDVNVDASKGKPATNTLTLSFCYGRLEIIPVKYVESTVTVPVDGAYPTTGVILPDDVGYLMASSGITWKNEDGSALAGSTAFEEGKKYIASFSLRVKEGYAFNIYEANVNNQEATVTPQSDGTVEIQCTFVCKGNFIEKVDISFPFPPVLGQLPYYGIDSTEATYVVDSVNWSYEVPGTSGSFEWMLEGERFEEGINNYTLEISLQAVDGFMFYDSTMNRPGAEALEVFVNGKNMDTEMNDLNNMYIADFSDGSDTFDRLIVGIRFSGVDFPACGAGVLRDVWVDGIDIPTHGFAPDAEMVTGIGHSVKSIVWMDASNSYRAMEAGETFVYGHEYCVSVTLKADDGYSLAEMAFLSASVNGRYASITNYNESANEVTAVYTFVECLPDEVREIELAGLGAATHGMAADYEITSADERYSVNTAKNDLTYSKGVAWYDETDGGFLRVGDTLIGGHLYTVHVYVYAEDGYVFANTGVASIDGEVAEAVPYDEINPEYVICVKYSVTAQHVHDYGEGFVANDEHHWKECVDENCPDREGSLTDKIEHFGGEALCGMQAECEECGNSYGPIGAHQWSETYVKAAEGHARTCTVDGCGAMEDSVAHTPNIDAPTETEAQKCTVCGYIIAPALNHTTHTAGADWLSNETAHWHGCTGCEGQQIALAPHADTDENGKCDVCAYVLPEDEEASTDAKPDESVPEASEPVESDPAESNPAESDPAESEPAESDPAESEPAETDPADPTPDSTPDGDSPDGEEEGLGVGAIVGIVVGAVAVVAIGGFALFWFVIKKKTWRDLIAVFKK